MHPTPTTSSLLCWRLRYPIKDADAGTPVIMLGTHRHDPDELDVRIGARRWTLPPYYLTPPPTAGWVTPPPTNGPPMTDQALLSITDTRRYLGGISRSWVYQLIESRDLERVHVGRRAMITRASADAYLERLSSHGVG